MSGKYDYKKWSSRAEAVDDFTFGRVVVFRESLQ